MRIKRYSYLISSIGTIATLCLLYCLTSATTERVYIAGHPFNFECVVKKTIGIPCPSCGGTRGFVMALHGDFYHSIQMNPLGLLLVLALIVFGISQLVMAVDRFGYCQAIAVEVRKLAEPKFLAIVAYSFVAVEMGQWLIKLITH